MTTLQFRNEDARIAYLATVYHLGRPGSDREIAAGQRREQGLAETRDRLLEHIDEAVVEVEMSPYQVTKLGEALLGVTNELKQYGIANGHSAVPHFADAVEWLYPETSEEPGAAMDIVQHAVMLQRRLGGAVAEAQRQIEETREGERPAAPEGRRRWQFWKRA